MFLMFLVVQSRSHDDTGDQDLWVSTSSHVSFNTQLSDMLGGGFKAERLKVNLRLVINRLKLLEKKKSE